MITVNEISSAVYGAYRLALRDPGGMAYFDRTPEGALKSFYAAVLLFPIHAIFAVTRWWDDLETLSATHVFAVEFLTYVIAWTIFPVAMIWIAGWLDRANRYCDFLVASNWASMLVMVPRLPLVLIQRSEILPDPVFNLLLLVFIIAVLVYGWFIVKTSLDIPGGLAGGLVAGEFILGLAIAQIGTAIIEGRSVM